MFCSKCGNEVANDAVFCPKCGNQLGNTEKTAGATEDNVVYKSKKELIHAALSRYMTAAVTLVGINPTFGELENYEESSSGLIYCELVASTRNMLGKTKNTRFGAVIEAVEADGNVVFKGAGPQMITMVSPAGLVKKMLGFK